MWLVLCNPDDTSALWAGKGLRARGMTPVEFVSPAELVCAQHLEYRKENGEPARALAHLASGKQLDVRRLRGTLNRATRIDYPQARCSAPADRNYVQAEMDAIILAWLGALPAPVFNPAHPAGWAGEQLHPFALALRAQEAGFITAPHRSGYSGIELPVTSGQAISTHIVFGGGTFPMLPKDLDDSARQFARSIAIPLLGITLAWQPDGKVLFSGATPLPDLRLGGDSFLDALTAVLTVS